MLLVISLALLSQSASAFLFGCCAPQVQTSCCGGTSWAYAPPQIIGYERIPLYAKVPVPQPAYPNPPPPPPLPPMPIYTPPPTTLAPTTTSSRPRIVFVSFSPPNSYGAPPPLVMSQPAAPEPVVVSQPSYSAPPPPPIVMSQPAILGGPPQPIVVSSRPAIATMIPLQKSGNAFANEQDAIVQAPPSYGYASAPQQPMQILQNAYQQQQEIGQVENGVEVSLNQAESASYGADNSVAGPSQYSRAQAQEVAQTEVQGAYDAIGSAPSARRLRMFKN
ncbi:unnamed protein product [Caenorhabditis bovis]|uniref:Uncharacterized protein n=1 Tax=Caenorhabditis bovis TaxID=2654633 RepID=A0A8S1E5V7_9PELO|nr:unnamed protein product [Caenorhabditis bovis]